MPFFFIYKRLQRAKTGGKKQCSGRKREKAWLQAKVKPHSQTFKERREERWSKSMLVFPTANSNIRNIFSLRRKPISRTVAKKPSYVSHEFVIRNATIMTPVCGGGVLVTLHHSCHTYIVHVLMQLRDASAPPPHHHHHYFNSDPHFPTFPM